MKEGYVPASTLFTIYFNMMLLQRAMTNLDEGNGIYIRYRTMKAMRLRSLKKSAPQNDHLHPLIIIDESEPKLIQTVQLFG
uniref:HTH La-type RNA-binding domain-containing protein n=1 Tax=Loa loa TaxID=7209 RepID=A0A1I7V8S0_LOALO